MLIQKRALRIAARRDPEAQGATAPNPSAAAGAYAPSAKPASAARLPSEGQNHV